MNICENLSVNSELKAKDDEEKFEHNLKLLKEWFNYVAITPQHFDTHFLEVFLRCCENDLTKAKVKLEIYLFIRNERPDVYQNIDLHSDYMKISLQTMYYLILDRYTSKGERVMILKIRNPDPTLFDVYANFKRASYLYEYLLQLDPAPLVFIADWKYASAKILAKLFRIFDIKFITLMFKGTPFHIQNMHQINFSPLSVTMINFSKRYMSEKLAARIHFHSSLDDLYKFIERDILPEEYGGGGKSMDYYNEQTHRHLLNVEKELKELSSIKVRDMKKFGDNGQFNDFGLDGSFRSLNLD